MIDGGGAVMSISQSGGPDGFAGSAGCASQFAQLCQVNVSSTARSRIGD
jgi:hypothetical protein